MSKATTKTTSTNNPTDEAFLLEQRKVKALEKIAASVDALTIWFEEINKDEWSERFAWYLFEFHLKFVKGGKIDEKIDEKIEEKPDAE